MSRDNAFIRNKLLDAFIPTLSLQEQASPFQPKSNTKNMPTSHSTSITRQSYINLDEKLQEESQIFPQSGAQFFSTETSLIVKPVASRIDSLISSQTKAIRKYLKVVSNPHEAKTNSPRSSAKKSHLRKSSIFQNKRQPSNWLSIQPTNKQARMFQNNHHQSCKIIQMVSSEAIGSLPSKNESQSVQSHQKNLQASKINSLVKLINYQDTSKTCQSISKVNYLHNNEGSSTIPLKQSNKGSRNTEVTAFLYPKLGDQSNILRIAFGKVQPVFRTIVRKDVSNINGNRVSSHSQLKPNNGIYLPSGRMSNLNRPRQQNKANWQPQNYKKCMIDKQNHAVLAGTLNLRSQIVQQVLR